MSSSSAKGQAQILYRAGSFGAVDALVAEKLHLSEGQEVAVREEDGRIVIEAIRPKILDPVSDVGARAERAKNIAASMQYVMDKHDEAFALLAK